jgi:hypothetical protein
MPSVVQPWVADLPLMQQSVLLTAVRGPDGLPKYHAVKYILRWYRRCILLSSFMGEVIDNPVVSDGGSFLGPSVFTDDKMRVGLLPHQWAVAMIDRATDYIRSLDEVPHHFQLHLMHSAEIVGYKHPTPTTAAWWLDFYNRLAHDMHLWPETEEQLDRRLSDTREGWLERGDVATND